MSRPLRAGSGRPLYQARVAATGTRLIWADIAVGALCSDFHALRNRQCVLQIDTQIANGAVLLRVAQEKLHRAQVARFLVDLRDLGPPHRVGAVSAWLKPNRGNPVPDEAGVLPSGNVRPVVQTPGPEQQFIPQ